MLDDGIGDRSSVRWLMIYDTQYTVWEASLLEDGTDGPEGSRAELRAFQNHRVATCNGIQKGARPEYVPEAIEEMLVFGKGQI